ncbi:unnamed protein product [Staurois parvus]|uniref:Uncharacterized protein n=1 Tax=Staurois parvus TaxID=386267 RepID=A0ABN9ADB0_9NEOB|nr:unnamed protein product [Staurois parvus]
MRHCKTDSYKHVSQRQRHDGTCSSPTAGGPQLPTLVLSPGVSNRLPFCCWKTTSPIMPLPLGVLLVTVNLAMPHGTCSLATAGGPPV